MNVTEVPTAFVAAGRTMGTECFFANIALVKVIDPYLTQTGFTRANLVRTHHFPTDFTFRNMVDTENLPA